MVSMLQFQVQHQILILLLQTVSMQMNDISFQQISTYHCPCIIPLTSYDLWLPKNLYQKQGESEII